MNQADFGALALRRLQRGSHLDWLLKDTARKRKMALEVRGTVTSRPESFLSGKREQASQFVEGGCVLAAVVVGFAEPCLLASTSEGGALP